MPPRHESKTWSEYLESAPLSQLRRNATMIRDFLAAAKPDGSRWATFSAVATEIEQAFAKRFEKLGSSL